MKPYGKELIIDIHGCGPGEFSREEIKQYFDDLCFRIDMKQCDLHFWDDLETPEDKKQTSPHTVGVSAIQFILTSNITIHTLPLLGKVFVNIFSCKDFNSRDAANFSVDFFGGRIAKETEVIRL